jgi:Tfp pilus assembly major pilin PilA
MSKILPDNRLILIVAILVAIAIPIFEKYREARRNE